MTSFPYLVFFYVLMSIYVFLCLVQYFRFNDKRYIAYIGNCVFMSLLPPLLTRLSTYSCCGDAANKVPRLLNLFTLTPFYVYCFKAIENENEPKRSIFLRQTQEIEMSACSVYELCDSIIAFTLKKRGAIMAGRDAPLTNKIWAEIETDSGFFLLPYVLDWMTKLSLLIHFVILLYDISNWFGPRRDSIYYILDLLTYPVYAYFSWGLIPSILSFFLFTCHCHDFAISAFKRRILVDRLQDKNENMPPQWGTQPRAIPSVVVNYTVTAPMITEASVKSRVNPHNGAIAEHLLERRILGVGCPDHQHREMKKINSVAMTDYAHPISSLFSPSGPHSAQPAVVVAASETFEDVTIILADDVIKDRMQVKLAHERVDALTKIFTYYVAMVLGVPVEAVAITSVQKEVKNGEILGSVRGFNEEYLYHQAVIKRSSESWQLILVVSLFLLVAAIVFYLASFFVFQSFWSLGLSVIFGGILIILVMRMAVLNGKLAGILTVLKEASSDDWPLYGGRGKILHDLTDNPIQFTLYGFAITYAWLLSLTTAVLSANLSVVLVIYSAALKEVNTSSVTPGSAR